LLLLDFDQMMHLFLLPPLPVPQVGHAHPIFFSDASSAFDKFPGPIFLSKSLFLPPPSFRLDSTYVNLIYPPFHFQALTCFTPSLAPSQLGFLRESSDKFHDPVSSFSPSGDLIECHRKFESYGPLPFFFLPHVNRNQFQPLTTLRLLLPFCNVGPPLSPTNLFFKFSLQTCLFLPSLLEDIFTRSFFLELSSFFLCHYFVIVPRFNPTDIFPSFFLFETNTRDPEATTKHDSASPPPPSRCHLVQENRSLRSQNLLFGGAALDKAHALSQHLAFFRPSPFFAEPPPSSALCPGYQTFLADLVTSALCHFLARPPLFFFFDHTPSAFV